MPTTETTYKKYSKPGSGDSGWGTTLNDQMINYVDANMGGILPISVTTGTTTLTEAESRNVMLRISGSLTGNVTIVIFSNASNFAGGFYFVENLTTNNFTVTIRNTLVGPGVVVLQNSRATLISDATNGVRIAASTDVSVPSGASTLFFNASAPLGWTKSTTHDNKALRIVSGSGGGSGGSTAFTSVFAARTIQQTNLPNISLTAESNGSHTHTMQFTSSGQDNPAGGDNPITTGLSPNPTVNPSSYLFTNTAGAHTHTVPLGGSGTAMDFSVQYVDAIICVKN